MRRFALIALLLVSACTGGGSGALVQPSPTPAEVPFRVISEEQNGAYCVEPPEFALARSDDEWVGVYSRQSDCQPGGDFSLPRVSFEGEDAEWALAAWWKVEGCLGYDVRTQSIVRAGEVVTVTASSSGPAGEACATALGSLESFLAVRARALSGAREIRFVLDRKQLGTVPLDA